MAISPRTRYNVLRRCNFACYYCGVPAAFSTAELHIDHVIPRALGGEDREWNLVAACRDCNIGKGATAPTAELIDHVRNDVCAYLSTQDARVSQCRHCLTPIEDYPLEDGEEEQDECEKCNHLISYSYYLGQVSTRRELTAEDMGKL